MGYRKDIQILRGVAVLFVVLYHLNARGFKSGFLGVDIFFVISGYLMAVMYDPERISDFYIKRANRLLPAYYVVIFISLQVAMVLTTPGEYNQVSEQAMFAAFFSSNIGFWMGYPYWENSFFRPLLHLWSLGVEIQFYIIMPLVFWAYKKSRFFIPAVALFSLMLCAVALSISPKTAFFLPFFRLWQFLFGFMVAKHIYGNKRIKSLTLPWMGVFFLICILCIPLIKVDGISGGVINGHPGLAALLVSVATAGLLSAGIPKWIENNLIANVLERVGKYSYAIYLSHFPVIVFYLYKPFSGTVFEAKNMGDVLLLILLIVCASAFLFHFVETPMRTSKHSIRLTLFAPLSILVFAVLGSQIQRLLIPEKEMLIYQAWFDRSEWRCGKINRLLHPADLVCELRPAVPLPDRRIFLVGDSRADAIKKTFSEVARSKNAIVYFIARNDPLYGAGMTPSQLIQEVEIRKADAIVLHYSPVNLTPAVLDELVGLAMLRQISISFIMPVPEWDDNVPETLINNLVFGEELPLQTFDSYLITHKHTLDMVSNVKYNKFRVYPVANVFCNPVCLMISEIGKPYYFDSNHLTLTGSELLRSVFSKIISDLK